MGEYKGYLIGVVLFLGLVIPGLFMFMTDSVHNNSFVKAISEVGELIKEEGGVVGRASSAINDLQSKGYEISYSPSGTVDYGGSVTVNYKLKYKNFFTGEKELKTTEVYQILKRDSDGTGDGGGGGDDDISDIPTIRTMTVSSNEFTSNGEYTQTFTIPNLKRILSISANTGSVEVVNVSGNRVTVRMKNGNPIIETNTEGSGEERKYVENYDHAIYEDSQGFKGVLQRYLAAGEYVPRETKYVSNWNTPNYRDSEGFTGTLERYVASGYHRSADSKEVTHSVTYGQGKTIPATYNYLKDGYEGTLTKVGNPVEIVRGEYIPAHTKWVTNQTSSYYNQEGYTGYLSRYEHDREYVPSQTKWVTNQTSSYYNQDGYTGSLSRYEYGRQQVPSHTKWVTNQTSSYYNQDGYTGTLSRYLHSGTYTPGETKTYTESYTGGWESTKKVPAATRTVYKDGKIITLHLKSYSYQTRRSPTYKANWTQYSRSIPPLQTIGDLSKERRTLSKSYDDVIIHGAYWNGDVIGPGEYYSTDVETGERKGPYRYKRPYIVEYSYTQYQWVATYEATITTDPIDTRVYRYQGYVTRPAQEQIIYRYQGYVTKPAYENIIYRYEGYVTRPAMDTRIYEYVQNYRGVVTRPAIDTRVYKYHGTVSKPEKDTRVYKYRGWVTKPSTIQEETKKYYQYLLNIRYETWD